MFRRRLKNQRERSKAAPEDRWRFEPISDKQAAFIQSLVSQWDPASTTHYDGASKTTYQAALHLLGLLDYTDRSVQSLMKGEASDAITRLKDYDP